MKKIVQEFVLSAKYWFTKHHYDIKRVPIYFSVEEEIVFERIQSLLNIVANRYIGSSDMLDNCLSLDTPTMNILERMKGIPYRSGFYRPDYIFDKTDQPNICEINTRFPLNGYFVAFYALLKYHQCYPDIVDIEGLYNKIDRFLQLLLSRCREADKVTIIKGEDLPFDYYYYSSFLESQGFDVMTISPNKIEKHLSRIDESVIIFECDQSYIKTMPIFVLDRLIVRPQINDLRTIMLFHDKCYLSLLSDPSFLRKYISDEDALFLSSRIIPTFKTSSVSLDKIALNKNNWVVKHRRLGKGKSLYIGKEMESTEWNMLLQELNDKDFVVQKYIESKPFFLDDNVPFNGVGYMLCCDDNYWGNGIFRVSQHSVVNLAGGKGAILVPLVS